MIIRVDLHCHGPEEWLETDKWNPIDISTLAKGKLEAMAITEMGETDERFEELKCEGIQQELDGRIIISNDAIYVPENNLLLLRTREIATIYQGKSQGHLLMVGRKTKFSKDSLEYVLNKANEEGAVLIADHMFSGGHEALEGIGSIYKDINKVIPQFLLGRIHAIEWNGQMQGFNPLVSWLYDFNSNSNQRAIEFANKNKIPLIASTDAHSIKEIGRSHTLFNVSEDWKNYLENIKTSIKERSIHGCCMNPSPNYSADIHALKIAGKILINKLKSYLPK